MNNMNVYTVEFDGYYPVGAVALVVAEDIDTAKIMVEKELANIGIPQDVLVKDIKEQDTSTSRVDILLNGDY